MEIKYDIREINGVKSLYVLNNTPNPIQVEAYNEKVNRGHVLNGPLQPNHYYHLDIIKFNIQSFSVIDSNGKLLCFNINGEDIEPVESVSKSIVNRFSPFIHVTGHQGSGTSVLLKSFRYFGAHTGDDSGDFSNRKAHESVNIRLLFNYGLKEQICSLDVLEESFQQVMGKYKYKNGRINIIKNLHIENYSQKIVNLFPNLKFISVVKHKEKQGISAEGKIFNQTDDIEILKTQNPPLEGQPMFHVDWNEYFTNINYAQKVLNYVGFNIELTKDIFDSMLREINFDINKLKK